MTITIIKKNKEKLSKKVVKDVFLKQKKTISSSILVSDMEIFLKKKNKRSINIVVKRYIKSSRG